MGVSGVAWAFFHVHIMLLLGKGRKDNIITTLSQVCTVSYLGRE